MKERQKHRDAFDKYFKLHQEGETVEAIVLLLASDFNVTRKTVYTWKKELNWDDREAIRRLTLIVTLRKRLIVLLWIIRLNI